MTMEAGTTVKARPAVRRRTLVITGAVVVLLLAMALDTRVVPIGSPADARPNVFSAQNFGETEFPKIQAAIEGRAVAADVLAAAIKTDQAAAAKQYGVPGGIGPEMSVKFTGVVGTGRSGVYTIAVPNLPSELTVRVQTGPAINGTELRDATGTIKFGQFTNQIEYQNAGSALNNELKKQVLSKIDTSTLTGKTIAVVGAFQLINPKSWLITPVALDVQ